MKTSTEIQIRPEEDRDADSIREVLVSAFAREQEADLVVKLRRVQAVTVSLVASVVDELVGHILFTPVRVVSPGAEELAVALGPMAVATDWQRRGVGGALVKAGLQVCLRDSNDVVFVLGHPSYYPRFGFKATLQFGLDCEFEVPEEAFMVAELRPRTLANLQGKVFYHPEFRQAL